MTPEEKIDNLVEWIYRERSLLRRIPAWPEDPLRAAAGVEAKLLRERDDALYEVLERIESDESRLERDVISLLTPEPLKAREVTRFMEESGHDVVVVRRTIRRLIERGDLKILLDWRLSVTQKLTNDRAAAYKGKP